MATDILKKELDEKLQAEFPWLKRPEIQKDKPYEFVQGYNDYENDGFDEVSDGWYELIRNLCNEITEIYAEVNQPVTMKLEQVRSKFGKLRWYYDLPGKEIGIHAFDSFDGVSIRMYPKGEEESLESKISECVKRYEAMSAHICEYCGVDNAELCNESPVFSWVTTLCPNCRDEIIARYNKKMEEHKKKEDFTFRVI